MVPMPKNVSDAEYITLNEPEVEVEVGVTNNPSEFTGVAIIALEISPRAQMIKDLASNIPHNDYGLPEYIYRVDMLPSVEVWEQTDPRIRLDVASSAEMELDYSQGFAALPTGDSFWSQLPYEGAADYEAFRHFLDMPRNRSDKGDNFKPVAPVRQLNLLKPLTKKTSVELLSLSYQYYWPERAKAFDLYMTASHIKSKELRQSSVENEQYERAGKFIDFAEQFLDNVFADPEKFELSPKEAMDLLFRMMQVQRLNVGLNPSGAHSGKDENRAPANANLEVIMRTIAKNSGVISDEGKSQGNITQQLLQDPEALMQAQELIIRMGDIKSPRSQKQGDHFDE